MKIAERQFIDAVTGEIKTVGDLMQENLKLKAKLKEVKSFLEFEFYGRNEWVKTSILKIIEGKSND